MCFQREIRDAVFVYKSEPLSFRQARLLASACRCPGTWWVENDPPYLIAFPGLRLAATWDVWRFLVALPAPNGVRFFLLGLTAEDGELQYIRELDFGDALTEYERLYTKWAKWRKVLSIAKAKTKGGKT